MVTVSTTIRINAPRPRVFEVFTELRLASDRIKAIQKIEVLTEGPIGKGTRFAETRVMFGRSHTETMEITDWNPPHSYTVAAESCGSRYLTHFTFQADGPATIVEVTFTATPIRFLAKLMSFMLVMMKNTCRAMFEKDMADLKAAVEGQQEPQPLAA
jgi:hypothetical protein